MSLIKLVAFAMMQLSALVAEDPRLKQGASGSSTGLNTSQQACACDIDEKFLSQQESNFRKNQVKKIMGEHFDSGPASLKPAVK